MKVGRSGLAPSLIVCFLFVRCGRKPPGEAARRVRRYRLPRRISYDALGQCRRAHPAAEVRVREEYATNLLDAVDTVRRGELDAVITALDTRKPPVLATYSIYS
ncbi:MAG: hypothetical protein ACLQUY_04515 [Ktedonobacterales bacterium]